jgi:hypothetical protein
MKSSSWTEPDNERLKALAARRVSIVRAAGALNRTIESIRAQARKLGTPFPTMKAVRKKSAGSPSSLWPRQRRPRPADREEQ